MKALLLRVGIDKTYGALSPVFADFTFEYIPIYSKNKKEMEKNERRTYRDLGLTRYLPTKLWDKKVHLDPEFETFTYGDPTKPKRRALLKLQKGDLLVFYMGGKAVETDGVEGCFIIGYFVADAVIDWNSLKDAEKTGLTDEFAANAHIISSKSKKDLVLVRGSTQSRMLQKCIPITKRNLEGANPPYFTSPEIQEKLGIRSFIVRAIPIWINDQVYLNNLAQLLGIPGDGTD